MTDLDAAIDFMLNDKATMAAAEVAYVSDGPNVQYEAQADVKNINFCRRHPKYAESSPNKGPIARPSCPDDLNSPSALPFAIFGCPFLPVSVLKSSSHCKEAKAVNELTTVALVKAMHIAAAWRNFMDIDGLVPT